jgi:hypothetical protein
MAVLPQVDPVGICQGVTFRSWLLTFTSALRTQAYSNLTLHHPSAICVWKRCESAEEAGRVPVSIDAGTFLCAIFAVEYMAQEFVRPIVASDLNVQVSQAPHRQTPG